MSVLENNYKTNALNNLGETLLVFGGGGILLFYATHFLIPNFSKFTGIEPVLAWFFIGGLTVFFPLLIISAVILNKENKLEDFQSVVSRLRFRKMTYIDWKWALIGLIAIGVLTYLIQISLETIVQDVRLHPVFMDTTAFSSDLFWLFAAWLPFWLLNIMGEEILWRGVILPRQEKLWKNSAWLINAAGWMLFHVAFGWMLLILLIPVLFIVPYLFQKTQNIWVAVILHAFINGLGFTTIAVGIV